MSAASLTTNSPLFPSKRNWIQAVGAAALAPAMSLASSQTGLKLGPRAAYFPNTVVHTHDGRRLRFYDDVVHGKVVVFNMMYTLCSGICPGNTANLIQVQDALGSHLGKEVFMYSLTLQPELDDRLALQAYVKRYSIRPGWTFLTGNPKEMDVIRRKLGFFNDNPQIDRDLNSHTGMVRIGHETLDRWFMMPALSSSKNIAREILHLL